MQLCECKETNTCGLLLDNKCIAVSDSGFLINLLNIHVHTQREVLS